MAASDAANPHQRDDAIRQQVQHLLAQSVFRRWPLSSSGAVDRRAAAGLASVPAPSSPRASA